jgi:NTE family protein
MSSHSNGRGNGRGAPGSAKSYGQVVLVLQGGGALGAFQAGVYHALHKAGIEPDWVVGTSIGAINASLIVGNTPDNRMAALQEFWRRVTQRRPWQSWPLPQPMAQSLSFLATVGGGIPGFFEPNPLAFLGQHVPLGVDAAGYYSTAPLTRTLGELVDFELIARAKPRLTVGAAEVRTSRMHYFDSARETIDVRHIMASGALPPAFPAVRIDDELYWDGGILSNTPAEVVFDDEDRKSSLIFAAHMWNPVGPEPRTIADVMHRQKDVQYSSRIASQIARQQQMHKLRHVINQLEMHLPSDLRNRPDVQTLLENGCFTRMHVVRLLAPSLAYEDQSKDVDFTPAGIRQRWQTGYEQTCRALENAPWEGQFDSLEGVILHEAPFRGERDMAPMQTPDEASAVAAAPKCRH